MQIDLDTLPDDPAVLQQMVRDVVAAGHQQQAALHGAVQEREAECDKLRLLIQRLLRNQFGRRSEQLDPDQLQLGLEDLEQTIGEAEAAQDAAQSEEQRQRRRAARPRRNHGALPAHLPRYEVVVDVEDKACPCCSGALHLIGEDRAEQLDILPARLRVRVTRRPRYGCRACEGSVVQAPAPDRLLDGGMATEALVAHIVVAKFCDHVPLYRQAGMLARQGVTLDRSTLANWVGRACWWLTPLYDLVVGTVLSSSKLFADDTTLPVLDPGRGRTKTGRLWCYAVDDRPWCGPTHPAAAYVYAQDRRGERPAGHLAGFRGVLQVDGYAGFKRLAGDRADGSVCLAVRCVWRSAGPICVGHFTSFSSRRSRRWRPRCSRASASFTRSRPRSAATPPNTADRCATTEVDPLWTPCTSGCTIIWAACRPPPSWRKPSAMRSGTGMGWGCSSMMAASRWTPTWLSAPSDRMP